jgi:hypothetical protein
VKTRQVQSRLMSGTKGGPAEIGPPSSVRAIRSEDPTPPVQLGGGVSIIRAGETVARSTDTPLRPVRDPCIKVQTRPVRHHPPTNSDSCSKEQGKIDI